LDSKLLEGLREEAERKFHCLIVRGNASFRAATSSQMFDFAHALIDIGRVAGQAGLDVSNQDLCPQVSRITLAEKLNARSEAAAEFLAFSGMLGRCGDCDGRREH
jgi:hypothetical protein